MAKEEKKAPKLRFNGYTNDWERKKLGIYVPIAMGQSPNSKNYTSNPRDNILVQGNADLYNNRVLKRTFTTEVTKTADKDDILMSVRAPVGDIARNQYESIVIGRGIAAIKGNNFLYYQLEKMNNSGFWKKYIAGSTFESINGKDLKSSDIYISNYKEEKSIGNIFQTLTKTIQLHERKCEELALIKQALLQKLFPKKDEVIPEVRYKSFSAAWEQRKVSELLEERTEKAPENKIYPLMAFIANKGVAPKGDRYDRAALVKDAKNKKYKRTKLGDFIYSSNNLETGSIGLNNYGNASISPVYSIFKPTGIANSDFIGRRFVRKDFINLMIRWRQGVVYGQWRIHEKDFLRIDVSVPSLKEQQKIGNFLSDLDSLITLHQRKLEKLKQLKKFLLQNMFI